MFVFLGLDVQDSCDYEILRNQMLLGFGLLILQKNVVQHCYVLQLLKLFSEDDSTLFSFNFNEAEKMTLFKLVMLLANSKVYKTMKMAVDK